MKTAIVVVEVPYGEGEQIARHKLWRQLSDEAEKKLPTIGGNERLGDNVWLIDVESGLSFLAHWIATLNANKMKFRVSFMDEPPKWIVPCAT